MIMASPRMIQAFPPGMVMPGPAEIARVELRPVAASDERAVLVRRREELIRKLAALRSHSHRRVELQTRLAETTRQLLVLECRR